MLTSAYEVEYAGSVVASAEKLRTLIVNTTVNLPDRSSLESGLLALGGAVRRFLSSIESIEAEIRHELELLERNSAAGLKLDRSSMEFLEHWKAAGYPARILRGNHQLNVMQIRWPMNQMLFILALGQLRGEFGIILSSLCEATSIELPEPLLSLTPAIDDVETAF
jgi:hypothetical protein